MICVWRVHILSFSRTSVGLLLVVLLAHQKQPVQLQNDANGYGENEVEVNTRAFWLGMAHPGKHLHEQSAILPTCDQDSEP